MVGVKMVEKDCIECGAGLGVVAANTKYCKACMKERIKRRNDDYKNGPKQNQTINNIIPDYAKRRYDHGFDSILENFKGRRTQEEYANILKIAEAV